MFCLQRYVFLLKRKVFIMSVCLAGGGECTHTCAGACIVQKRSFTAGVIGSCELWELSAGNGPPIL